MDPTEKQIKYALKLGIEKPESYSRTELSKKIDEAKENRYPYGILKVNGVKHTNWCKIWKTGTCNCGAIK